MTKIKRVTIFCGAQTHKDPEVTEAVRKTGELLGKHSLGLVYGGGDSGLMRIVADAAMASRALVTGVIPKFMNDLEWRHPNVEDMQIVDSMATRKRKLIDYGDALVTLPGGWGSLEEFFQAATESILGLHTKPVGLLNAKGYYNGLLIQLERMQEDKLGKTKLPSRLIIEDTPEKLIERILQPELEAN